MPVTAGKNLEEMCQRHQYAKRGIGRKYWDFRDDAALKNIKGQSILDAGCGEGITLEKLVARFPSKKAIGIDIDPLNVSICQSFGLNVIQSDLKDLPFENETFDSIFFMEVIEHLFKAEGVLKELARVIKSKGNLIVVFPVDWAMWLARIVCLRFREARFDPAHVRQWNFKDLRKALNEAGFEVIKQRGLPLSWPFMLHGLMVGRRI